jgi:hypothetical protein
LGTILPTTYSSSADVLVIDYSVFLSFLDYFTILCLSFLETIFCIVWTCSTCVSYSHVINLSITKSFVNRYSIFCWFKMISWIILFLNSYRFWFFKKANLIFCLSSFLRLSSNFFLLSFFFIFGACVTRQCMYV